MSLALLPPVVLIPAPSRSGPEPGLPILRTAGSRPGPDEGTQTGPPPATEARAQRILEATGLLLILVILVSAAWIMIRKHR